MNVVFNKPQENCISYNITKIIFNREEKGGACVRQLCINSNTRAREDYRLSVYIKEQNNNSGHRRKNGEKKS